MKKIYLMAIAIGAFAFTSNAQLLIDQNFDGLNQGPISAQDPTNFRPWDNDSAVDPSVVADQSQSAPFSLNISGNTTDDVILQLGSLSSGVYTLRFNYYIPTGAVGFYGFMRGDETAPFATSVRVGGGPSGEDVLTQTVGTSAVVVGDPFNFPRDQWVSMEHVFDLDSDNLTVTMDGEIIYDDAFDSTGTVAGVDMWSINEDSNQYYDDIVLAQGLLGVDDFSADNFSVYPNPVRDILNIQTTRTVESVVIYDVLGKVVVSTQPDAISPRIDMSELSSGAYMVNVTIDGASKTVKVIK